MDIEKILKNNTVNIVLMNKNFKLSAKGFLLKKNNNFILTTAAHCVYDYYSSQFFDSIYFKHNKEKIMISKAFVHKKWIEDGILDYDVAFLEIDNTENLKNIFNIEPLFNMSHKNDYYLLRNKIFKKKKIVHRLSFRDYIYDSSLKGIKLKTKVGDSGSPWLVYKNGKIYQNSNTSLSFNNYKNITWGPDWGEEIKNLYTSTYDNIKSEVVDYVFKKEV